MGIWMDGLIERIRGGRSERDDFLRNFPLSGFCQRLCSFLERRLFGFYLPFLKSEISQQASERVRSDSDSDSDSDSIHITTFFSIFLHDHFHDYDYEYEFFLSFHLSRVFSNVRLSVKPSQRKDF